VHIIEKQVEAIRATVAYLREEREHFHANPSPDHIYHHVVVLAHMLGLTPSQIDAEECTGWLAE